MLGNRGSVCHHILWAIKIFAERWCMGLRARAAIAALITASIATVAPAQSAGRLVMTVTGVRNAAFPKPGHVIAPIRASQATCMFTGVPAGNYAIAFFHAQQNETQLTPRLFGKPTQGYGFSNNAAGSFGPPNFTAAAFAYDGHPAPSPTGAVFMLAVMSARRWRATTATSAPAG